MVSILLNDDDDTIGTWQPVEYENISHYFEYCRHQGHDVVECKAGMRNEKYRQRKEPKNYKRKKPGKTTQKTTGGNLEQNKGGYGSLATKS